MSDKFKNSKFYQTMKNPKVSRALYISVVIILVALAMVIGLTAAANRSKKNEDPQQNVPSTNVPSTQKPPLISSDSGIETEKTPTTGEVGENEKPTTSVSGEVPTLTLPVSGKASKLHDAKVQVFSETMNDYRVHLGVDILSAEGSPVYAAADGKIEKIWKDALMGYCIAVTHAGDAVTIYKNLSDTLPDGIVIGAKVKSGQQIATVGGSAMVEVADEAHLHFEMTVGGILVDPIEYFSKSALETLKADEAYGE